MTIAAALGPVVARLEACGIPYMVVGSFASSLHGEPRVTHDLDLVIDPEPHALDAFLATIPASLYVDRDTAFDALARRSMFNIIDTDSGWKLDLIVRKDRAFSIGELARRQPSMLDGVPVYVATAEDTVIAKLEWAKAGQSARQLDDVRRLLGVRGDTIDRAYVERWVAELGLGAEWDAARA